LLVEGFYVEGGARMIPVKCKECGESWFVGDDDLGKETHCPGCHRGIIAKRPEEHRTEARKTGVLWEYYMLVDLGRMGAVDEKKLNDLGLQGWELVDVFKASHEEHTTYYFKRQKI
jgi:hypothetical protein